MSEETELTPTPPPTVVTLALTPTPAVVPLEEIEKPVIQPFILPQTPVENNRAPTVIPDNPYVTPASMLVTDSSELDLIKDIQDRMAQARENAVPITEPRVHYVELDSNNIIIARVSYCVVSQIPENTDDNKYIIVDDPLSLSVDYYTKWPRDKRDSLLTACDWTQNNEMIKAKSEEWVAAWAAYRGELRNLPTEYPDPLNITWPTPPTTV